jgi:hypothetical protein
MTIGAVDLLVGAGLGGAAGAAAPAFGAGRVAVLITCGWALMRVFAPPGLGSEAITVALAAGLVWVTPRLIGRDHDHVLAALHVGALMAAGLLVGELLLDSSHVGSLRGIALPLGVVGLLAVGPVLDRALQPLLRGRSVRLGVQVIAAGVAMLVWGRPLVVTPLRRRGGHRGAAGAGHTRRVPGLPGHDPGRPSLDLRVRA